MTDELEDKVKEALKLALANATGRNECDLANVLSQLKIKVRAHGLGEESTVSPLGNLTDVLCAVEGLPHLGSINLQAQEVRSASIEKLANRIRDEVEAALPFPADWSVFARNGRLWLCSSAGQIAWVVSENRKLVEQVVDSCNRCKDYTDSELSLVVKSLAVKGTPLRFAVVRDDHDGGTTWFMAGTSQLFHIVSILDDPDTSCRRASLRRAALVTNALGWPKDEPNLDLLDAHVTLIRACRAYDEHWQGCPKCNPPADLNPSPCAEADDLLTPARDRAYDDYCRLKASQATSRTA